LRGDLENPGAIPPLDRVFAVMRDWGLEPDAPTVVVHDGFNAGDFGNAARVYWSLKSLGVEDIAILNDGLAGWAAAGLPVSVERTPHERSSWQPMPDDTWRITTEAIAERLAAGAPMTLVDARPAPFFEGRVQRDSEIGRCATREVAGGVGCREGVARP
jgi:thiosulfate/3-mercaptopyruvate sulfurtransferase